MIVFFHPADVLHDVFRAKPSSNDKCTSVNRFFFNWRSLSESQQHKVLPVEKAILRAYLKVIPRFLNHDSPSTTVSINIYMKLSDSSTGLGVHAGETVLSLTPQSGGWVELNITKGVKSIWPPPVDQTQVEITVLTSSSNCLKKAPALFEDPTAIPLSQSKRRQRLYALQPLFLVHLSDNVLKEVLKNQSSSHTDTYSSYNDDISSEETDSSATEGQRRKRQVVSSQTGQCGVEDFMVTFEDLNLHYIIAPVSFNAKQCRGSCSHSTLTTHKELGNNYAKIMASANLLETVEPGTFPHQPKAPCCVPTKYDSLTVITPRNDMSLKYVVYSHMVVEECRCR